MFLGEVQVEPLQPGETVVLINLEMDENDIKEWLRGIQHPERVVVFTLEGLEKMFDVFDQSTRLDLIEVLQQVNCKALVVDCAAPAILAVGKSENNDLGEFLVHINAIVKGAGVSETVVVHHAGLKDKDRGRGHSHQAGWYTTKLALTMANEDDIDSRRWILGTGRDVRFPKRALDHDPVTRMLTLVPVGVMASVTLSQMAVSKVDLALNDVIALLRTASGPLNQTMVVQLLKQKRSQGWRAHSDRYVHLALKEGATRGTVVEAKVGKEIQYSLPRVVLAP